MGLLSIFGFGECDAQQPQYWGENPYNLANVDFGINAVKFYSKAIDENAAKDFDFDKYRYYSKTENECRNTEDDKKMVILDFSSSCTDYSEVLANFDGFEFPYTGMLADKKGKMIGIIASGRLDKVSEVDSLLFTLAKRYGSTCYYSEGSFAGKNYGWHANDKTIQLYVREPDPDHIDAVIYYEVDEKGNRKIVAGGSQPHTWYEIRLIVTQTKYDPFISCISMGEWTAFRLFDQKNATLEIDTEEGVYDTGILFTEEDLVPSRELGCMTIPDGCLPRFTDSVFSRTPDFRLAIRHWMSYHAYDGLQERPEGSVSVSFIIGKDGEVKKIEAGEDEWSVSPELKKAAINAVRHLPRFAPATQNGTPVSFRMTVPLQFRNM